MKVANSNLTPGCSESEILDWVANKLDCEIVPGEHLIPAKFEQDKYGNYHYIYMVEEGEIASAYQVILHFNQEGELYYINGTLMTPKKDGSASPAKAMAKPEKISPDRASIIASGSVTSKVKLMYKTHRGKAHLVYEVIDKSTMHKVYVDANSGEILSTIPMHRSFGAWDDIQGTKATVKATTMYYGEQDIDVLKTESGYVLRDPERKITTLNSTGVFGDKKDSDFLNDEEEQTIDLIKTSPDYVYADEQSMLNAKFGSKLKSISLYGIHGFEPESLKFMVCYADPDGMPLLDESGKPMIIVTQQLENITWTRENDTTSVVTYTLPEPLDVNLLDMCNVIYVTCGEETFMAQNLMMPSNYIMNALANEDGPSNLACRFEVVVDTAQPALSIHWGVQKINQMYKDYFNLDGCDGKGAPIINLVNPGNNIPAMDNMPYNAFACGVDFFDTNGQKNFLMVFGMGTPLADTKPLIALDLAGHEYTHNVTAGCGNNLMYENESGAIDEGTADCMGMVAEEYALGQATWQLGDALAMYTDNTRCAFDPWLSGSINGEMVEESAMTKYYGGRFWHDYNDPDPEIAQKDRGGVHRNCTIMSHWFYLLCEGAQDLTNEVGQTHNIEKIGMPTMRDILLQTMIHYDSSYCDYAEFADNVMVAIEDIHAQNPAVCRNIQAATATALEHVGLKTQLIPTGIENVYADGIKSPYAGTYNLFGAAVGSDYKGIVIQNGRKVLRK